MLKDTTRALRPVRSSLATSLLSGAGEGGVVSRKEVGEEEKKWTGGATTPHPSMLSLRLIRTRPDRPCFPSGRLGVPDRPIT